MDEFSGWWLDEYDGPRFHKYVNRNGGWPYLGDRLANATGQCWEWIGTKGHEGYGQFRMGRRMVPAHRIAYLDGGRKNVIPDGYEIDHLCRNRACVNPGHLEPVTRQTNIDRSSIGNKTHCPSGHEYTAENTRVEHRDGKRVRRCRICLEASKRRTYLRRTGQLAN